MSDIILATSSKIRQQLFARLQLAYTIAHPDIDETPLPMESPENLVCRLAKEKALKVSVANTDSIIIACDQVIVVDDKILGKPGTYENAVQQLQLCSDNKVTSLTGLCVGSQNKWEQTIEFYYVYYKKLTASMITNYLRKDEPYFCAGSIQAEQLGPALFSKMEGDDPTALLGLPLIRLIEILKLFDVDVI